MEALDKIMICAEVAKINELKKAERFPWYFLTIRKINNVRETAKTADQNLAANSVTPKTL